MMKGLTLQQLAAKLNFNAANKKDYIVPVPQLTMQIREKDKHTFPVLELYEKARVEFPMLPLVHDQVGSHLSIPAKYYDKMLNFQPQLLALNVNTWLKAEERKDEKRMLRTLGEKARGFLSNRYQRIENEEIAEVALPILGEMEGIKIVACEVTDKRLYIQAVTPKVQGEIKKGDPVQAGVIISNSEVGCGAVSVASVIWRLMCLNGMIGQDKFRAFHIGKKIDDNEALWADDTKRADDTSVLLKVRDMVKACVDAKAFEARLNKMRDLTEIKVETNPAAAVEVLAQKVGAGEGEKAGILKSLIEGGDLSAWGLLNAVTHQAHKARDFDRAVEFEAAGGMLLNFTRPQWREVLEAA